MANRISRRTFLQGSGLGLLSLSLPASVAPAFAQAPVAVPVSPPTPPPRVPSLCAMCRARCHVLATVDGERVTKVEGNDQSPLNGSALCARGQAAMRLVDDPDRLKYPLQRVGERGDGKWKRISWEEALAAIAGKLTENLTRSGPESIALFAGGPSSFFIKKLFADCGITQIHDAAVSHCDAIRNQACRATFGFESGDPPRLDYRESRCIVLLGNHFGENVQVPELRRLLAARQRGAELIVVDPRFSAIAAKAGHYLPITPGTDTALLLGWMHHLVFQGLYDKAWVEAHCTGFAELTAHLRNYPVQRVAEITGLTAEEIIRTAELMAAAAPAVIIHPGGHLSWYGNDVQRVRAQTLLMALLGAVGRPGALQRPSTLTLPDSIAQFARFKGEGSASFSRLMNGILDDSIRVVGCWGQNPLQNHSSPFKTVEAFKRADFVFCCDVLPGEATLYADIILPEATFLERYDVLETGTADGRPLVAAGFPAIAPRFEAREPYQIVKELADRLARPHSFSFSDGRTFLDGQLVAVNLSLEELRTTGGVMTLNQTPNPAPDGPGPAAGTESGFPTGDGKIALFSADFNSKGWDPLPGYEETPPPPAGYFRLLSGRSPVHTLTATINNPWLLHEMGENELWLNDTVAAQLGMKNGDAVLLENQDNIRSLQQIRVKVTPGIRPDCVYLVHGFGCRSAHLHAAFGRGVSDTALMTRSKEDPLSGARGMRVNFVRPVPLRRLG